MNKTTCFRFFSKRHSGTGQGLVEYVILIAVIGLFSIFALTIMGGSVEGGFIKVCAELGNDDCQAIQSQTPVAGTVTLTPAVPMTPSPIPTPLPTLAEPNPTRLPDLPPALTAAPEPTLDLKTLRIKVITKAKDMIIQVVVYNTAGVYVAEGMTDNKGNISFTLQDGDYIVATNYNNVWQKDGPFSTSNPREHVIHR